MLSCSRFSALSHARPLAALGLALLGAAAAHPAFAQTAVLTQDNDNARSGSNTAETVLTPQNVKTATFGKLFTMTGLNANVNGQVLYVPGVTIGGAKHNALYAYTSNNSDNSLQRRLRLRRRHRHAALEDDPAAFGHLHHGDAQSLTRRPTRCMCWRKAPPTTRA